jgi:predicted nucleotidyltransferase
LQTGGVKSLAIFGSVARGDDTPGSDVDVLVELSRPMGLFGLSDLRQRLKEILEVDHLDLITRDGIHPAIKDIILSEAINVI